MTAGARTRRALVAWALGLGALRLTFWAPEVCPPFTADQARAAAISAGNWIAANQVEDGRYLYEWDRSSEEVLPGYNIVRHAGVTMSLYQLVDAGQIEFLDAAEAGLAWMIDRLVPASGPDGESLLMFSTSDQAKLGASALVTVSLAHRRLITGDMTHDETMLALGRFMQGQQLDNGAMLNLFDTTTMNPVPEETSVYSTGEALWALAMLHEGFPEQGFDASAWLTLDYMSTERDMAEDLWPQPWPDQWAAYSLAEMAEWGLAEHHVDYARRLAERYAYFVRFDSQRGTTYGNITHGPSARGAGHGTWIEGLAELREVMLHEPELTESVTAASEVLACGASRLAERQERGGPDVDVREAGAWFYDDKTRMDDQQHAASGLLAAEMVLP